MHISQILYLFATLTNVYAFIYSPVFSHKHKFSPVRTKAYDVDMSNDYLNNINKQNFKKLEGIRNNITKYITANKSMTEPKLEKGRTSTYRPIPKTTFDTIFLNINHIHNIYISYNVDRMIFEMKTGARYVYYVNGKDDYNKMEQLMKVIPGSYKAIIINDVSHSMDDPFGFLYCEKK